MNIKTLLTLLHEDSRTNNLTEVLAHGDSVKLHYPEHQRKTEFGKAFHGKTGRISDTEGSGKNKMYRVRLDTPAKLSSGDVHDDLWSSSYLKRHRSTMSESYKIGNKVTWRSEISDSEHGPTGEIEHLSGTFVGKHKDNKHLLVKMGGFTYKIHPNWVSSEKEQVSEDAAQSFKIGDHVIPRLGPHRGQPHEVIHVHVDGRLNLVPKNYASDGYAHVPVKRNRYHLGAVTAKPGDVAKAKAS